MRILVAVLLLAACKDKAAPPAPAPETPTGPALPAASMRSTPRVDLTTTTDQIKLIGVTLLPTASQDVDGTLSHDTGVFVIEYMAAGSGGVYLRTMCRVGDKNLASTLGTSTEAVQEKPTRFTSMFRPDPYKIAPTVCELRFFYPTAHDDRPLATACYRNSAITDGACPRDAFPPPTLPTGSTAAMEIQSREVHESVLQLRLVVTVGATLPEGHGYRATARCETADQGQLAVGEDDAGFLQLEALPAGGSVEGPLNIFLDHPPGDSNRCELQLTSLPTDASAATKRTIHATYCLVDAKTTTLRACDPPLGGKP